MSNTKVTKKKGEKVYMYGFTGMFLGEFEVTGSTKTTVSITKKNGTVIDFDRETGKQLNVENERFASSVSDEARPKKEKAVAKASTKKAEKPVKKAKAVKAPEPDEFEDAEVTEDEYEEA